MSLAHWFIIGGGFFYLWRMKNAGDKLSFAVKNIDSIKLTGGGITIFFNVTVDNPSRVDFNIKKPGIRLLINETQYGNSIAENEEIKIPARQRTEIKMLNISIPYLNAPSLIQEFLSTGLKGKVIELEIATVVNGLNYTAKKKFEIGKDVNV